MKENNLLILMTLGILTIITFTSEIFILSSNIYASTNIDSYQEQEILINFNKYKVGDYIPSKYLMSEYVIKQWKLRNLPAPETGTHWTYIGEHYLLINNISGKIYKMYNGDILYLKSSQRSG